MKKLYLFFALAIFCKGFSQHFEVGPNFGYGGDDIVNSKATSNRAVIGDALWSFNYGASVVYYFKQNSDFAAGIHIKYNHNEKGSVGEIYSSSRLIIPSEAFSVAARISRLTENRFDFFMDLGFGYDALGKMKFEGTKTQDEAFNENLVYDIVPKNSQIILVYGLGLQRMIPNTNWRAFIELGGDAGISKISSNLGSYRSQNLAFLVGAKYVFKKNGGKSTKQ